MEGKPAPPFDQYAIPFRPLKQTVWSLVGSGGETASAERRAVLDFAKRCPNLTGFIMDDFFQKDGSGQLTVEQLRELRKASRHQRKTPRSARGPLPGTSWTSR